MSSNYGDILTVDSVPDYIGAGYSFHSDGVYVISLRFATDRYYMLKKLYSKGVVFLDDVEKSYAYMAATKMYYDKESPEYVAQVFTEVFTYPDITWSASTLEKYIKGIKVEDIRVKSRFVSEQYIGLRRDSVNVIYKKLSSKVNPNLIKTHFLYEWMLTGNYIKHTVFAKYIGLSNNSAKLFFYQNKNLARYVKIYNNIISLGGKKKEQALEYLLSKEAIGGHTEIARKVKILKETGRATELLLLIIDKVFNYECR